MIFEHLGDEYGWHVFKWSIPLPVIVCDEEGGWHVFSSARLQDGGEYEGFYIAEEGDYAHKVVGRRVDGSEYRPWDFSITKNVFALILCALVLCWLIFPLVRWYKKKPMEAPRRVKAVRKAGREPWKVSSTKTSLCRAKNSSRERTAVTVPPSLRKRPRSHSFFSTV